MENQEGNETTFEKFEEMLPSLPRGDDWLGGQRLVQYKGFWLLEEVSTIETMSIHHHFKPRPTDVILASFPKCGTTWQRALLFAITNRNSYDFQNHPLLTSNPQDLVPSIQQRVRQEGSAFDIETLPSPRLLPSHYAFSFFPTHSMASPSSPCRFVYVCRNPKAAFVSRWHFYNKMRTKRELPPLPLEDAFNLYSQGVTLHGPFWDHVLGYWKASLESPNKVLFLKYEDMKKEPSVYVRKVAEFLDLPFSAEEEDQGIVEKIVNLCSFQNLSNIDVNKSSNNYSTKDGVKTSHFYRKGEVDDWANYLTPEMAKVFDQITQEKFRGTGLNFD